MIANYQKPQVLINEILDVDIPVATPSLNAMIIGPQFSLHRYGNPNDTPVQTGTPFAASTENTQLVPYEGLTSNLIIDQAFGGLYGASLEGELWTASSYGNEEEGASNYNFNLASVTAANQIQVTYQGAIIGLTVTSGVLTGASIVFAGGGYTPSTTVDVAVVQAPGVNGAFRMTIGTGGTVTAVIIISSGTGYLSGASGSFNITGPANPANVGKAGSSLLPQLYGRPMTTGDILYTTFNGVTSRRTVASVTQATTATSFGTDTASANETFAASALNPTETDTATFGSESAPSSWGVWPNHTAFVGINVTNSTGLTNDTPVLISAPISLNAAQAATAVLTPGGANVSATDTVVISVAGGASFTYTFVASLTPTAGQVLKGSSIAASMYNLYCAINNNGQTTLYATGTLQNTLVTATAIPTATNMAAGTTGDILLTAIAPGTAGNNITIVSTGTGSAVEITTVGGNTVSKVNTGTCAYGQAVQGTAWPVQQAAGTVEDNSGVWSVAMSVPGSGYFHGGVVQTLVSAGGTGYNAPPEVVFGAPAANGVQAQGVALISSGVVTGIQITDPGKGYTTAPSITLVGQNTGAASASCLISQGVGFISVDAAGSGYTSAPIVQISRPNTAWGQQATAVAIVSSSGTITAIQIVNPGSGYTSTPFVSLDSNQAGGSSATIGATVVLLTTAPVVSSNSNSIANGTYSPHIHSSPTDWNGLVQGASYAGQYGERYTITVTSVGSGEPVTGLVRIRSSDGKFTAENVSAIQYGQNYYISDPSLGGLVVELAPPTAATPLSVGAQFSFTVVGKYVPLDLTSGGEVTSITITSAGSGYTSTPSIAITAPPTGGTQATAYAVLNTEAISSVIITNPGSGYVYPPVVTVTGGGGSGGVLAANISNPLNCRDLIANPNGSFSGPSNTQYQITVLKGTDVGNTDNVETGAIVSVSDTAGIDQQQQYTLTTGQYYPLGTYGLQFQFPAGRYTPSGTSPDTAATATALAVIVSTDISYIIVTNGGSGYVTAPNVTITGGGGSAGAATAVLTNGVVTSITVSAAGSGYTSTPTVTIAAPPNTAQATGTATEVGGAIAYCTLTNGGSGYVSSAGTVVTLTGGGGSGAIIKAVVENGAVIDLQVVSGGSGYSSSPTVTISAPETYQPGLRTGDVYYINAVAATAAGAYNTIVLSGSAVNVAGWSPTSVATNYLDINTAVLFSGLVPLQGNNPPTPQWALGTAAQGGIIVQPNLSVFVANRTSNQWVLVQNSQYGMLYASWRGLVPAGATTPLTAYANTDTLIAAIGPQDYDNPACWGGCIAINASQGKPVYVATLPTNDLPGYQAVLNQALRIAGPTYLAPMTTNFAIQQAVQEHCDAASAPNVRHFRRCYLASQNPGNYQIYATDSNGNPLTATILSNGVGNVLVTSATAQFITQNIQAGSLFQTQYGVDEWGNPTFQTYVVAEVTEQDQLLLVTGPNAPISPAIAFQIWAPNTGFFQAAFEGNLSTLFADRRAGNVWCDTPQITNSAGLVVNVWNPYLTAEIAGLRSVMPVQMGLTRTPMTFSMSACPLMYTKYTDTALDSAAKLGTWIITQDYAGGPVYTRHQLTTNSSNGPLYYEDSVGVSLDAIAYDVDAMLEPYIGARNANIENVEEIDTGMRSLLDSYLQSIPGYEELGPILAAWSGLSVTIPVNAVNTINIYADLQFSLPIGLINVTLQASTINGQTLITINTAANTGPSSGTDTGQTTTSTQPGS